MTEPEASATAPAWIVAGEALVDLASTDAGQLRPTPGGSPYNAAIGLGRLEVPTGYLGALSSDAFGRWLTAGLHEAGVDLSRATEVAAPTTLAVVHLDPTGRANYGFYLEGTAAGTLHADALPALPPGTGLHVSFGAIGASWEPTGTALAALLQREAGQRLVSLDPNLRPPALGDDPAAYRRRLEQLVRSCDLVRASDEDLAALGDVDEVARRWARLGPALVVVTRGADGVSAYVGQRRLDVEGRRVAVTDTVGAGDAFTAGLLWSLHRAAVDDRAGLTALAGDGDRLRAALADGIEVAAATCARAGADPPRLDELFG